jgi:hypothetical protein
MNDLLIAVFRQASDNKELRDKFERAYSPYDEVRPAVDYVKGKASAAVSAAKGVSGKKDLMTKIENFINKILDWIADHKPAGVFADYRTKEEIVALANKLLHAGRLEREEAEHRILKKHKDAFKGMNEEQLGELHDRIVREDDPVKQKAAYDALPEAQKAAFDDMKVEAKKIFDKLVAAGILPANQYRENHMGQSIRWFKNGVALDDSITSILRKDTSQFERNKRFLEEKTQESTASIRERFNHKTINPLELFANYVEDAHMLIAVTEVIAEGRSKGLIKQFKSEYAAAAHSIDGKRLPMVSVDDNAFKVIKEIPGGSDTEIQDFVTVFRKKALKREKIDRKGNAKEYVTWVKDQDFVAPNFETQEQADAWIAKQEVNGDTQYSTKATTKAVPTTLSSDMYFDKDLAHLINTILSKDKIRSTAAGEYIMNLKNTLTMFELSLSAFHWLTIAQENVSSYAAWKIQQNKLEGKSFAALRGMASLFNPIKSFRESRELKEFTEKVITDPDYAATAEGKAETLRLLGTDSVDMVDVYQQFFRHGGMFHQDESLRSGMQSWGTTDYKNGLKGFVKSQIDSYEELKKQHPDSKLAPLSKSMLYTTMVSTSGFLMEEMVPRVKFAAFAREYTMKLQQQQKLGPLTDAQKAALARDTMKFVEDRFGEVNWKNMWLDKSYKTALQFLFRSFTWVAGSWKALAKAGVDWAKLGWFTLKGEEYHLTEKGYWGISAVCAHIASVGAISLGYMAIAASGGGDEQETEEDTPLITRLLFPRVDPYDNTKRITIPSYVSEAYKIMMHFGIVGGKMELEKLVTGRFNSMIGRSVDLMKNEDFRGVKIINPDDNIAWQSFSFVKHVLGAGVPMSLSGMRKIYESEGMSKTMLFNAFGAQDAPASAKRSSATNLAYDLSRREYKGKEQTEDDMELKDDLKRAMSAYVKGDKSKVDGLLKDGKISKRQYDIAMTRYPILNNAPNTKYKDNLSQALNRLSVKSAIKVYEEMSQSEKAKHKQEIVKKINNMRLRHDTPQEKQAELIGKWNTLLAEE